MGALTFLWFLSHANPNMASVLPTPWPCRIAVPRNGPSLLSAVWELSPTFQHQCTRLAAAGVVVVVQWDHDLTRIHHAETRIVSNEGRVFRAVITLRPSDEPAVHLVHEIEHIMEALDGVDQRLAKVGWKTRAGAYETIRARRVEAWARRELAALSWDPQ
jgi:hypothetical protein